MFVRHPKNPLISPSDIQPTRPDFEIIGTFNAGATQFGEETILLLRVAERPIAADADKILCPYLNSDGQLHIEAIPNDHPDWDTTDPRKIRHNSGHVLLTSVSHLRLARSKDGVHFTIDAQPWLTALPPYEAFGVEDARITKIDHTYYVNYTAVSPMGIATGLVSTKDFVEIERHGIIFPPSNRDVTLLPEKINGHYICYHRPMPGMIGGYHIWSATSPDLIHWGNHQVVLESRVDDWTAGRVGGGAPPIRTDAGWLSIYHAADRDDRYCLGAYLTDLDNPSQIIANSEEPIFEPEATYETNGFYNNVVFTCGTVLINDVLRIYYGAADEVIAMAETSVDSILETLRVNRHVF